MPYLTGSFCIDVRDFHAVYVAVPLDRVHFNAPRSICALVSDSHVLIYELDALGPRHVEIAECLDSGEGLAPVLRREPTAADLEQLDAVLDDLAI